MTLISSSEEEQFPITRKVLDEYIEELEQALQTLESNRDSVESVTEKIIGHITKTRRQLYVAMAEKEKLLVHCGIITN